MSAPDPVYPYGESYPAHRVPEESPAYSRYRDLPRPEKIRTRVEETVRGHWLLHGRILTANAIGERWKWKLNRVGALTEQDIAHALNDPVTIANLRTLGILPPEVMTWDEVTEARLAPTTNQLDALDAIFHRMDPAEKRSLVEVLEEHGIDLKTWNGYLADPIFAGYVRARTDALLGEHAHEVDIALMRRVIAGEVPAIKLMLQLQGRLADHRAVDTGQLLGRVLEILIEEITDTATVERIARRFEALAQQITHGRAPELLAANTPERAAAERATVIPGEVVLP